MTSLSTMQVPQAQRPLPTKDKDFTDAHYRSTATCLHVACRLLFRRRGVSSRSLHRQQGQSPIGSCSRPLIPAFSRSGRIPRPVPRPRDEEARAAEGGLTPPSTPSAGSTDRATWRPLSGLPLTLCCYAPSSSSAAARLPGRFRRRRPAAW